jgi:outer membrane receptor protein involved in Fe transport
VIQGGATVPLTRTGPSFFSQPFNFARLETSGIDVEAAYRTRIGDNVTLNLRGIVSWVEKRNFFTDVTNPNFADRAKSELGDPEWSGNFNAGLDFGMFDVRYNLRWIGEQTVGLFEAQNSFQGRAPLNPDQFPFVYYNDVFYHDLRFGFEPQERFKFYVGVDNVLDRAPPFGIDATGAGGGIFENVGRFFYAGAEIKF